MMTTSAERLIQLAKSRFTLNDPELKLLRKVVNGEDADYHDNALNDPANTAEWDQNRTLPASLIVWLCTDPDASACLTHRGLSIVGAKIEGSLNLQYANLEFPLIFRRCAFTEVIRLERAKVKLLDLSGSYVASSQISDVTETWVTSALEARGIQVESDVLLLNGFNATGRVSLIGATIGGNLDCHNGTFNDSRGFSLLATSAEIKGNVLLRNEFNATGCVSLLGAAIGGNLDCHNGTFKNDSGGDALLATSAEIKGAVLLSNEFNATGRVSLYGVTIGGNLNCHNGTFKNNSGGDALLATSAEIKGAVLLRNGFNATGRVSLLGATIGGSLDCHNGTFKNDSGGDALLAQSAEIKGAVLLSNGFNATGRVSLLGATIGGDLDCHNGTFKNNSGGNALLAQGAEIKGNVLLRNEFNAKGRVSFMNANIDDRFVLQPVHNPNEMRLDLRFATIGALADQADSWPKRGDLFLDGLVYDKIDRNSPSDGKSRLEWLRRQPSDAFSPQPYEQLAQVLQASGHEEAAAEVLIGKQNDRRRYGGLNWIGWFWNRFLGITIAHGYKPKRALWASLGIIGFGIIPFQLGYAAGVIEPSELEAYSISSTENNLTFESADTTSGSAPQGNMPPAYPEFFSPVYSIDVFLPIIDFHQESYWIPKASRGGELFEIPIILLKVRSGGVLLAYFWLHIALGWVFTSLWVAGFTGLVRSVE